MRILPLLASLAPLLLAPAISHAGSTQGKITILMAHSHDIVIFRIDAPHTGKPACSSDEWALSLANPGGRGMYALLLSAQAQGKSVTVYGSDACGAWADREEPVYLFITN
ncbi:hypothetical protein [Cognatilysobacter terrigena]|uniref:hypothetical protein n=1 Tax=Cognatilysobacter terrigena TaxID=2488749 RepID=UPI00106080D9|nr:hypothetical protein [Lysobacter terrigena]